MENRVAMVAGDVVFSEMRDHTKLKAFQFADEAALLVYQVTRKFPKEELYGLTSQIRRAAVSVPSNIVEGCARSTIAEYRRFLEIAFGSAREYHYQISLAHRIGCMDLDDFHLLDSKCEQLEKVLGSLLRSL